MKIDMGADIVPKKSKPKLKPLEQYEVIRYDKETDKDLSICASQDYKKALTSMEKFEGTQIVRTRFSASGGKVEFTDVSPDGKYKFKEKEITRKGRRCWV